MDLLNQLLLIPWCSHHCAPHTTASHPQHHAPPDPVPAGTSANCCQCHAPFSHSPSQQPVCSLSDVPHPELPSSSTARHMTHTHISLGLVIVVPQSSQVCSALLHVQQPKILLKERKLYPIIGLFPSITYGTEGAVRPPTSTETSLK